jgi:hypothetical protein
MECIFMSKSNFTFCDGNKVKSGSGSGHAWTRIGLAPWIQIRIWIHIEEKSCFQITIRIRIETNAAMRIRNTVTIYKFYVLGGNGLACELEK